MTIPIIKANEPFTFVFLWQKEKQGYEWVRGLDSEPRLVARGGLESQVLGGAPLKMNPRLFLRFAALKRRRADIQRFANRHGVLFNSYSTTTAVRRPAGKYRVEQLYGTSLRQWRYEIEMMRCLVRIWQAIKHNAEAELEKFVVWNGENSVGYRISWSWGDSSTTLAGPNLNESLLDRFTPPKVLKPALYLLQAEINKRIDNLEIRPQLVWCPGPRIEVDGVKKPPKPDHHQRIIFVPKDLLAAMWLQFAQAVTGEYQIQECENCGNYIQVGPGALRRGTKTCTARCRQALSRRLRKEAKSLR